MSSVSCEMAKNEHAASKTYLNFATLQKQTITAFNAVDMVNAD